MAFQAGSQIALDPRERPPASIMAFYKQYQKRDLAAMDLDPHMLDLSREPNDLQRSKLTVVSYVNVDTVKESCATFNGYDPNPLHVPSADLPIYECKSIPGKCA